MKKKREYRKIKLDTETKYLFGNNIKRILKEKGLKQKDLAKMMNTSPPQISRYINAECQVSINKITKFADALEVQPIELLITDEAVLQLSAGRKLLASDKLLELFKVSEKLKEEQLNAFINFVKQFS